MRPNLVAVQSSGRAPRSGLLGMWACLSTEVLFCRTADPMSREEPESALFVLELVELYRHRSVSSVIRRFVTG